MKTEKTMQKNDSQKNKLITLAALAFLFCTRWMVYRLERTAFNLPCFAAECALFLLVYALCLFGAPPLIRWFSLLFGCVGIGCLYAASETVFSTDLLLPLTYFSALLFFTDQSYSQKRKQIPVFSRMLTAVMFLYHWLVSGLTVYTAATKEIHITVRTVCCMLPAVLLGMVYALIMRAPLKDPTKKQKQNKNESGRLIRSTFRFAVAAVPLSCLYPAFTGNRVASETLLLLWAANLPLLYLLEHPLITSFAARYSQKQKHS